MDERAVDRHSLRFAADATLYYAGAPADDLYLIREGRVRLIKRARGRERITGVFGRGELVGEESLVPGAHRTATAQAVEPVTALVVGRDTFRTLIRSRPEVGEGVLQQLVLRLRRAEEQVENFLLPDPTLRVVNTLLHAIDDEPEGTLGLSPFELSTRTGLDLERVKGVMRQLQERGYLTAGDQTITIRDSAALRQLQDLLALKEDVRHGLSCR